jgi:ATP-dependent DNA helicase RecQ
MVFYGQTGYCRWKVLLQYFDEDRGFERCNTCDNCLRMAARQERAAASAQRAEGGGTPTTAAPPLQRAAFAPGEAVKVRRYGRGSVVAADADTVTVAFDGGTERCFQAGYVQRDIGGEFVVACQATAR